MIQFHMNHWRRALGIVVLLASAAPLATADTIVNFHDLALPASSAWNGSDKSGTPTAGWDADRNFWVESWQGSFTSAGLAFPNSYTEFRDGPGGNLIYTSWDHFAYSTMTSTTTPGFTNQFSAYAGGGVDGAGDAFAVVVGHAPTVNPATIASLPTLDLAGQTALGMYVTNTTYAALSMLQGDGWNQAFSAGDWFKLSIHGLDAQGLLLSTQVDFWLADYTSANQNDWYILDSWQWVDLAPLADARSLVFNLTSSDNDPLFGMNTPGYFAFDNLSLSSGGPLAVPEPASLALLSLGGGGLLGWVAARRRRR